MMRWRANLMMNCGEPDFVPRRTVALDQTIPLTPGLTATLFAVPGKVPLYQEGATVETGLIGETTVGVELRSADRRAFYIPGCADMPDWLRDRVAGADALFFDGTLWDDDEMIRMGLGRKTGRRMGHMAVTDTIPALADTLIGRRIFVHMNNSNPLTGRTARRRPRPRHSWQVGRDGMEITL